MALRRCDDKVYTLASGLSATGSAVAIPGGEYMFFVEGTVSGATISLQIQAPSGNWVDVQVYTGAVVKFTVLPGNQTAIDLPAGNVRMASTGGAPSGLNAYLVGIG